MTMEYAYLDYAASTPVLPEVLEDMRPYFSDKFGNPSSIHQAGQSAEAGVEEAREIIADCLKCSPREIVFTSCGTESDNLALRGTALAERERRGAGHILISPVEHHAVSTTARQIADHYGFEVEYLPVDSAGRVDPEDIRKHIRPDTAIVSVIHANNEIGTINPIMELAHECRLKGVPFHTDAVQAAAYEDLDMAGSEVDLLSIGAHKFYGPKGVGALYIRNGVKVIPQQTGGGQENQRRAGTLNVPYIIGMASALRIANNRRSERISQLRPMRDRIIGQVLESIPNCQLTGSIDSRMPNHASFVFRGADGNFLLALLDSHGYACSSGSACKTGSPEPSDVLLALGLDREWALGSLRITLGESITPEMVEGFLGIMPGLVEKARHG